MEDVRRSDYEVKGFDEVMDFMQEDDDLIAPSAHGFDNLGNQMSELDFVFSESMKGLALADSTENEMSSEQASQPSDSMGLEANNRNRKCNLRKSLAWDSAFFTSAGVLDPEELSSMIGGAESGGRKVLPGIQEDDMRSSVSTLDSDTLTLESLEAELFQDIRASIQKSNKAASNIPPSDMSSAQRESRISIPSLTKNDHSSEIKAKLAAKNTPRKLHTSATKSLTKNNQENHDDRCKETSSFRPKLPNGPGKLSAIPPSRAKRVSISANHSANDKHVPSRPISVARVAPSLKLSASSKPVRPRPTTTSKVVSVSSKGTKKEHSIVRSSAESTSSVSSSNAAKIPLDSLKKNSASETTKLPASTSTVRVPSRIKSKDSNPLALKTKAQSLNSRLSTYVKSTATNVSGISPASSISEWSIESSSSTSTVNQRSNNQRACVEAAPISMSGAVDGDYPLAFDSRVRPRDSKIVSNANTVTGLSNNSMNEPKPLSSLPRLAAAKPSGLRMPSPKIGFFDGVKSLARTPKRAAQFNKSTPSRMAKGEGIAGGSSNAGIGKIQLQASKSSQKKDDAQPAAAAMKPAPHIPGSKLPNSATKKQSSLEAANHDHRLSSKLEKGLSPKTGGNSHLNPADVSIEIPVLPEGTSHGRFYRQNDTRIGGDVVGTHVSDIFCDGEDGNDRFYSSLADDSAQKVDKVPSKIDLPKFEGFVKKVSSETKVRLKSSSEANDEGLDLQRYPVISPVTYNDAETANDGHTLPEHNSIVNSDKGAQNLSVTSSVTEGSKDNCGAATDSTNAVHNYSCVGGSASAALRPLTEDKADKSINGNCVIAVD